MTEKTTPLGVLLCSICPHVKNPSVDDLASSVAVTVAFGFALCWEHYLLVPTEAYEAFLRNYMNVELIKRPDPSKN